MLISCWLRKRFIFPAIFMLRGHYNLKESINYIFAVFKSGKFCINFQAVVFMDLQTFEIFAEFELTLSKI